MIESPAPSTVAHIDFHGMVMHKCKESVEVKQKFFELYADAIGELAQKMAQRFSTGRRLWIMGNGGSACDAQHTAVEFVHPIIEKRKALPAIDLVSQMPLLTAIANDKDYARVFVDQIELWSIPGDMVLAFSTSGNSPNLIYALEAAKRRDILTVGASGRDGGRMSAACDYCFTVPSYSTHRIQESHVALLHILWDLIHVAMGEEDVI